ncbi:MAG TPA: platelet-activating factor acetylhydrolase IB subunit [Pontiellaceae bacterium]|nr:platelet-activating factor acetylhydrolase IB subunit [Pontiellaceae bacterium]
MKKKLLLPILCISAMLFNGCLGLENAAPCDVVIGSHKAVTPAPRADVAWWMPRHQAVLDRISQGNVDLLMIGDSITHGWEKSGKATWNKYYAPRNAVNMGFSGDRTEHVLWRLQNGEIKNIKPKLAVLMIGTNNSNGDQYTAEQIADGIKAIVCTLRTNLPETKVLILAIFPRGDAGQSQDKEHDAAYNEQWAKNDQASRLASKLADGKMVFYLDVNKAFLSEQGVLTREIMPDLLHPKEKGYQLWAAAMEPTIAKLMGETK